MDFVMSDRSKLARGVAPRAETQLAARHWIEHANELLIDENIRGVQIATLCKRLGVTKGSFYWHFKSRQHLLEAILEAWRKKNTLNVMNRIVSVLTPLRSLRGLLSLPRRPNSIKGARVELSVRDWSRRDDSTFRSLQEIDVIRLRGFEQLFRRMGFAAKDARARAYVAYAVMMGDSILKDTIADEVDTESFLSSAVALLTTPLTPAASDQQKDKAHSFQQALKRTSAKP
jgi:AcrR family transcriptional regulator